MDENNFSTHLQNEYLDIEERQDTPHEDVIVSGLSKKLYEVYYHRAGWVGKDAGYEMPQWDKLSKDIKEGWRACAIYVIKN